jgi:Icc-related predicted phosphoesterase
MITLPITEKSKQEEWKAILTIAKNNGYPINTINKLKIKLIPKKKQQYLTTISRSKKWVTFTYVSPKVRRITNLFNL